MAMRKNPAMKIAQKTAHKAVFDSQGKPKPGLHSMLLRAVEVQRPLVLANLRRLQRRHPRATAAQLADKLERDYLFAVTGGGALVGGTAVIPGVGTVAALGLSAAATVGFLEATALYATSLAELHGIRMVDPEKASTLVMAIMLGEEGTALLGSLSGQAAGQGQGPHGRLGFRVRPQDVIPRLRLGAGPHPAGIPPQPAAAAGDGAAGPGAAVRRRSRGGRRGQPRDGTRRRRQRQGGLWPHAGHDSRRTDAAPATRPWQHARQHPAAGRNRLRRGQPAGTNTPGGDSTLKGGFLGSER